MKKTPLIHEPLLDWYRRSQREMPWRSEPSPYRTWISEIMLQQTQVETVRPYFERFIKRFPDVQTLAAAPEEEVLKHWEGLGYYTRAKNLRSGAQKIAVERAGIFPSTFQEWLSIPGVGSYTAAAVASIAFGENVPVVDGNVLRVYSRLFCLDTVIQKPEVKKEVFEALTPQIEASGSPSEFNQAMMELGALVCRPKSPDCLLCPLQELCQARKRLLTDRYPLSEKKKAIPHKDAAVAVCECGGKLYFLRREERLWHGLWVFPFFECETPEATEKTLCRELSVLTSQKVKKNFSLGTVRHVFTHFSIDLHAFYIPVLKPFGEGKWIALDEPESLPLPVPMRKILEIVQKKREKNELGV